METKLNGDHLFLLFFDPLTSKSEYRSDASNSALLCALNCASKDVRGAHEKSN